MDQPPPPQTGEPPPPYSLQPYPGVPPNSGYVQPSYPGQPAPQLAGIQYGYPATAVVVSQPGVVTRILTQPPPKSYMVISVWLGCLCCLCIPLGIGAIIASTNVQSAIARGDIPSAKSSSKTAKVLNIIYFMLGL
ncbi:proline-rich transmembrane protein 1-like [Mizuhopecten yessoensis]|uniref:proline-rich transmembrane protein 1-like n=1 Tax=Mizuhopecten yessoensis TaxID=6573 RepID=UPI000B4590A5|nr:proline-rich transmembrane protein 1-like [Mizuhopecten yessoensis]